MATHSPKVALVGDHNPAIVAHQAIEKSISLLGIEFQWIGTSKLTKADDQLASFDGIWCVPASPYENTANALDAIRYARVALIPFLGSCGGFQHALMEFAANVRHLTNASHQEIDPATTDPLICALECSLVNKQETLHACGDGFVFDAYGEQDFEEEYHCSFGLNAQYEAALFDEDFSVTARNADQAVRAVELHSHPFFVITLFQSERRALRNQIPPLVVEFGKAIESNQWTTHRKSI